MSLTTIVTMKTAFSCRHGKAGTTFITVDFPLSVQEKGRKSEIAMWNSPFS